MAGERCLPRSSDDLLGRTPRGRFEDYREAVRNLSAYDDMSRELIRELERLPSFRDGLIHECVGLDLECEG